MWEAIADAIPGEDAIVQGDVRGTWGDLERPAAALAVNGKADYAAARSIALLHDITGRYSTLLLRRTGRERGDDRR